MALGLGLVVCTAQALAQAPASLAQAVEAAWQRAALSAEVAGQARRAQAERAGAAALWAAPPAVEVGTVQDRQRATGTARETTLGLSVPLWLPGQRLARQAQVEAELAVAPASSAAARLRLAGSVREAASAVALQLAEVATAQSQFEALRDLASDVERRVAAGDLARADALAAHAERLAAGNAFSQALQRLQSAQLQWRALTGFDEVPPLEAEPAASGLEHPGLRLAALKIDAARQRIKGVQASQRDAPQVALRARQEVAAGEPSTHGLGVSLRIPLGTAGRNEPLMAAALSELAQAEASERELRLQLDAELATAQLAQAAAFEQLTGERSRAVVLQERAQLIEKSFKAGETALPDMLRALTAATQAHAAQARAQALVVQATLRLHQAQGIMP